MVVVVLGVVLGRLLSARGRASVGEEDVKACNVDIGFLFLYKLQLVKSRFPETEYKPNALPMDTTATQGEFKNYVVKGLTVPASEISPVTV
jgi:hypothetical protein